MDCAVHLIEEDILIVFDKILLPNRSPVNENENISFEINFISIISHKRGTFIVPINLIKILLNFPNIYYTYFNK